MTTNALENINELENQLNKYILGQNKIINYITIGLLSSGHILLEGVPGTAKTSLVKVLAKLIDAQFNRIQLTPDMMPSDITGNSIYDLNSKTFHLHKGPIFTNIVLADEINRTPPKTQSALLEAMEEKHVTIDGQTMNLPEFFMVIATQNSIEFEGTYPLPEAQLDRFMFKLNFSYPDTDNEIAMLKLWQFNKTTSLLKDINSILQVDDIKTHKENIKSVKVENSIFEYLVRLASLSRNLKQLKLGASPRATLNWLNAAKALAYMQNRDFVIPDDIKYLAEPILEHRLILTSQSELDGIKVKQIIQSILDQVSVPR